jgi:hypothetical protein
MTMLASRTAGEKRLIFMFVWVMVGVLYFHVRITGGFLPDLINKLVYPDATAETRKVDHVVMPYREARLALDQELDQLLAETASDQSIVTEMAATGNDAAKLMEIQAENEELAARFTAARESDQRLGARLVRKDGTEAQVAQLQSQVAQLAAKTGLKITGTRPVLTAEDMGVKAPPVAGGVGDPETRAVEDSPVITVAQLETLLNTGTLNCQRYTLEGNSVMLFVFLEQLKKLPWDVYVVNLDVLKEARTDAGSAGEPKMEMVLVY